MRAPLFRGTVEKGRLKLDTRERFQTLINSLEGKKIEIVLREKANEISREARGYYKKVVCGLIAEHTGDTPDGVHEDLKRHILIPQFDVDSTTKLSSLKFREYITAVIMFAAKDLGVVIPEPQDIDY